MSFRASVQILSCYKCDLLILQSHYSTTHHKDSNNVSLMVDPKGALIQSVNQPYCVPHATASMVHMLSYQHNLMPSSVQHDPRNNEVLETKFNEEKISYDHQTLDSNQQLLESKWTLIFLRKIIYIEKNDSTGKIFKYKLCIFIHRRVLWTRIPIHTW